MRLCRHREVAEYMREGTVRSRRTLLRWRSDYIPTDVVRGARARPRIPHTLRHCKRCNLAECEDAEHVLLRCPTFTTERAELVAAVRRHMPRHVVAWAGSMEAHQTGGLRSMLDGELQGGRAIVWALGEGTLCLPWLLAA